MELGVKFAIENSFDEARSCLEDALFVAREREYHGVATLIGCALERLETIGKLTGIHKSRLIGWQGPETEKEEKEEEVRDGE